MPFTSNPIDGVQIYYESIGSGQPLTLHQGFMRTTIDCHELGYVGAFQDEYQVILLDARGHGQTDGPHDPSAYTGELYASDVIAVLDELRIDKTHFVGYSSGGRTAYALMEHYPERLLTLAIGGKDVLPLPQGYLDSTIQALGNGIEDFINERERLSGNKYPANRKARFLDLDAEALANLCTAYMSEGLLGLNSALKNATMPILLYVGGEDGDLDKVKKTAGMIPRSEYIVLPGLNHGEGWENTDLAIPVLSDFLSRHR